MQFIIVRHGKAEADSPTGRDEDRRLKKRGQRQARYLGEQFADNRPAAIICSPHERAIATANIIRDILDTQLQTDRRLELGSQPSDALDLIAEAARHFGDGPLMLVGHNPQLGQLLWVLTRGTPAEESDLRTGEAAILNLDPTNPVGRSTLIDRLRLPEP